MFDPYKEKWSNLTNIFQMGWNHQLENEYLMQLRCSQCRSCPCMSLKRHYHWTYIPHIAFSESSHNPWYVVNLRWALLFPLTSMNWHPVSVSLVFRWGGWFLFVLPFVLGGWGEIVWQKALEISRRISTSPRIKDVIYAPLERLVGAGGAIAVIPTNWDNFDCRLQDSAIFVIIPYIPETNMFAPAKIDGWKMKIPSLVGQKAYFQGFLLLVSGSVSGHLFGLNA